MYECGDCGKAFPAGWKARDQHCNMTGHDLPEFECDTCDAYFGSEKARRQHMSAKGHFSNQYDSSSNGGSSNYGYYDDDQDWECALCDFCFGTEDGCNQHMVEDHLYCNDCDRSFMNYNNIKQHLNSKVHRGSTIKCPFCAATYATATGMVHHLERGCCPRAPELDRHEIYRLVHSRDPNATISKHSLQLDTTTYSATERAWNGRYYECYLCHRQFNQLSGLNQHLSSPIHQEALYHCPNFRCRVEFKTLAAIINHLESETCGAMRFEAVQQQIGNIVSGNRLLRF
ncbi:hypothetical protein C8A00DRAFT_43171 [Chaetomidium leptoderma]|uniref:C2H2-type domain-containing protein n=1 Tax=Chaetomidium leptoderma TaxID=669021 RepID=A0AAN6VMM9_9PEZI|nr:hypothetical protein C8A00DRAFT_43171 [Chaetomidium leptoderma]